VVTGTLNCIITRMNESQTCLTGRGGGGGVIRNKLNLQSHQGRAWGTQIGEEEEEDLFVFRRCWIACQTQGDAGSRVKVKGIGPSLTQTLSHTQTHTSRSRSLSSEARRGGDSATSATLLTPQRPISRFHSCEAISSLRHTNTHTHTHTHRRAECHSGV
jgi:hypothetical protein